LKSNTPGISTGISDQNLNELLKYPNRELLYNLDKVHLKTLTIGQEPGRNGVDDIAIWIDGVLHEGIAQSTIDLNNTGIGGRVDGQTFTVAKVLVSRINQNRVILAPRLSPKAQQPRSRV
jgi:hypothetical protein